MSRRWPIACDDAELVVESAAFGEALGLKVEPILVAKPADQAIDWLRAGGPAGLVVSRPPPPAQLVALATAAREAGRPVVMAILGDPDASVASHALAQDLGIVAVEEVRPLASAIALIEVGDAPWSASTRGLPDVDRVRLRSVVTPGRQQGRLTRENSGLLGFTVSEEPPALVGEPRDVALAIAALRGARGATARPPTVLEGVDPNAVLQVIFGPPRALSDPASKAALAPYGVPIPLEELCTSPSRAAAEAARIGFPVRIGLASPDLRVWDHPDLAVDGVDGAARVREIFRQLMILAEARAPKARLLGVTVTATSAARALLRVHASPLPEGLVLLQIGFADAHGVAAGDHTHTVLPAQRSRLERVLGRLAGSHLLLEGTATQRRQTVTAIADVLLRVAAFVDDRRAEVTAVEMDPLAVLVGGSVEIREACVTVGDAFLRSLESPAAG